MIFSIAARQLISYDESNSPAMIKLSENFKAFKGGLFTFPLDIPGTSYHARLQVPTIYLLISLISTAYKINNISHLVIKFHL